MEPADSSHELRVNEPAETVGESVTVEPADMMSEDTMARIRAQNQEGHVWARIRAFQRYAKARPRESPAEPVLEKARPRAKRKAEPLEDNPAESPRKKQAVGKPKWKAGSGASQAADDTEAGEDKAEFEPVLEDQSVLLEEFVANLLDDGGDNGEDEFYAALGEIPDLGKSELERMSAICDAIGDKYDFDKIEFLDAAIQRRTSDLCTPPPAPHAPPSRKETIAGYNCCLKMKDNTALCKAFQLGQCEGKGKGKCPGGQHQCAVLTNATGRVCGMKSHGASEHR